MKKIHSVAFVLFIATALSFTTKFSDIQNTITATFIEITNDDFFKFIDTDKSIDTYKTTSKPLDPGQVTYLIDNMMAAIPCKPLYNTLDTGGDMLRLMDNANEKHSLKINKYIFFFKKV